MTCHQFEQLLPLYVGHDLEERRERSLEAHLQSCAGCIAAVTEYRETREMLQEIASSSFNEDVYAEIRQNVWRQIETQSIRPSLSELVGSWFRPRLVWAAMAALLITISAIGIYFIENRWASRGNLAGNSSRMDRKAGNEAPPAHKEPLTSVLAGNEEHNRPVPASRRQVQPRMNRNSIPVQPEAIAINSPGTPTKATPAPSNPSSVPQSDESDESTKTLRLELQTKNPNIRIIWLSQRDTKQMSPNSKGI